MAEVQRSWTKTLAVTVLLMVAWTTVVAQSVLTPLAEGRSTGSLSGKITDLHSHPLGGVVVLLRNQATGYERRATTTQNGTYRFSGLEPGEYALRAESSQLGQGQVEGIVVDAGFEARVQAALQLGWQPTSKVLAALPGMNRPDLEPTALPASQAALASEPLQTMPLSGRRLAEHLGYAPRTETPAINRTLANEPLGTLAQAEQSRDGSAPATFAASTSGHSGANGSQVSESRAGLSAGTTGNVESSGTPGESTVGAATVGATQMEQAASRTVQSASQQNGPATQATSNTISATELQALPVNGRHWQDFVLDNTPTSVTPAAGQGQISLRGSGQQQAGRAVDGQDKGLAFGPTGSSGQESSGPGPLGQGGVEPAGMARVGIGGHGLALTEAAIRVVQTVAGNVETAAARAVGGRLDVETMSGGNQLHGQGFVFDRQSAWGAQNPFTQWVQNTGTITNPVFTPEYFTPPDRETTWGLGVGGRIRRNSLFWFAALDSSNRNDPGLSMVQIPEEFFSPPTNDDMQVLSARLGLGSANPVAEGLAAYTKLMETLDGLLGPAPRTATQWTGFSRLDWEAAERHHFTLEGTGAHWNAPGGGLTRAAETYGNHSFGSSKASEMWLLGRWEAFLTPNLLSVAQASAGRDIQEARPETPSAFEQTLLSGNVWGQLPQVVVDSGYGFTIGNPSRFGRGSYPDERLYHGQEAVDWISGKLLVKAGFELSHNADTTSLLRNQTGTYYYASVEDFASDALVFGTYGLSGALDPFNQHNCDETGKASWRDSGGNLRGLGNLPCYAYYSQTIGPAGWHLSTNDWAGYATAQWQAGNLVLFSAGLRWEREQLPPPLAELSNPGPLLTQKLPNLGNDWGPRLSLAVGKEKRLWPLLRLGYGMYFGRTPNLAVETALTQTGSLNGDLSFFLRPTDDLPNNGGGAPPFPYVLQGEPGSVVKPGAVEFAPRYRNSQVHQAVAAVEEMLPGRMELTTSAMVSLARRLPISIDTNFDPALNPQTITYNVCDQNPIAIGNGVCGFTGQGPIKAPQITVPFYASWPAADCPRGSQLNLVGQCGRLNPNYQQITQIMSRSNSTYEAAMLRLVRYGPRGLSLRAHYIYSHAMDWNPNESGQVAGNDVLDPANFRQEYGVSNLDVRHSAVVMAIFMAPWKLSGMAGKLGNGWMLSGIGQFRSGLPYTMRTSGWLPKEFDTRSGAAIVGLGPGMNGSGGDNRIYGMGSDNIFYNIGRNTFRYPATWKADLRVGRRFNLGHMRELDLLAESFNLFNHENVTELETTGYTVRSGSSPTTLGTPGALPSLNFLTGLRINPKTGYGNSAFGQPLNINATGFYRERQVQFGLRMRF